MIILLRKLQIELQPNQLHILQHGKSYLKGIKQMPLLLILFLKIFKILTKLGFNLLSADVQFILIIHPNNTFHTHTFNQPTFILKQTSLFYSLSFSLNNFKNLLFFF
eukprot:UN01529